MALPSGPSFFEICNLELWITNPEKHKRRNINGNPLPPTAYSMIYIIHFLITAAAIYIFAQSNIVPGITFSGGYTSALLFAVVLALVNLILGTVLRIVSLPLRIITLGLFSFIISGVVIYVTDQLVPSVTIIGIPAVFALAVVLSVTSFVLRIFK
jgi:putative membrane protein